MKVAVAHRHVVAVALEVECLAVATALSDIDKSPLAVHKEPVFAAEKHPSGHAVKGEKAATDVVRDTILHAAAVHPTDAELPLVALLEKTILKVEVAEVVNKRCIFVEIIRTIGPKSGSQPAKDAILHRDVGEHDFICQFKREEANTQSNFTLGVVFVMLVEQRIVKVTIFNPDEFFGWTTGRVFAIDAGHAAVEFEADKFETALIG